MATGILLVLDDIGILADKAAIISKIALKKTAGILGDDLAVNAEKVIHFKASRELPVLLQITKGSFKNKAIIMPIIFLLNYYIPALIIPILIIGGLYLAYEGSEKILEYLLNVKGHDTDKKVLSEEDKIKSAILTDFILSIEIVVIALSTVLDESLIIQVSVVTVVSLIATVGVYGLVGVIIRLDDIGLKLIEESENHKNKILEQIGEFIINLMPLIIKSLTIIGTIAMLLVASGIITHNISAIHHIVELITHNEVYLVCINFMIALNVGIVVMFILKITTPLKKYIPSRKKID